jgi:hypothetical protein
MILSKKFLLLLVFGASNGMVLSQNYEVANLDKLAARFITYIRSDNKEKINIVTDKIFYAAGESIWLKAWCVDSLSGRYIRRSKNLFVDLVDDRDSSVVQLLLNNDQQKTVGRILLPGSLKEGYYWLRAYTKNILHEDSNRIFVRPIYVLNVANSDSRPLSEYIAKPVTEKEDTSSPQLTFFPEGGALISGTTATIAFRCADANDKPLDVSGYVTDTRNDTVGKVSCILPGMGKISFDVFNPRKYFAHIQWKNHRELIYPLPHINQIASQLSVVDQTDQVFHIRVSLGDSLYKKNKMTYILGISRDSLCFAANGTDMYDVTVPKNSFPQGIATLFLFNDQDQIVSQRAIYIDSGGIRVDAVTDKPGYSPREKVKLDINVYDNHNHSLRSLLSVSVTDELNTGIDESPVFNDEMKKQYSAAQKDLHMLTQKRLYSQWEYDSEIKETSNHENYDDKNLLNIRGRMVNKKNEPLKNNIVNLFSGDKGVFKIDTTNNDGHFMISMPDYDEGTQFDLKLTNLKGQGEEGRVIIDNFNFPQFSTPIELKKGIDQSELVAIRHFKTHQSDTFRNKSDQAGLLKSVTIRGVKQKEINYDASKRVSIFSDIITSDQLNNGDPNSLVNAISNVQGFNSGPTSITVQMVTIGGVQGPTITNEGVKPLLIMDGTILTLNTETIQSFLFNIEKGSIDFVEILKGPQTAIYGMQGAGGVILINTTNKRKEIAQINDKGLSTIFPKGYSKQNLFTVPDYDKPEIKKSQFPDLRSTLYWNGNVLTDSNGKASLEFYTSDRNAKYSVSIVGITKAGEIIKKRISFNGLLNKKEN